MYRSRLQKLEEKRNIKTASILAIGAMVVIILVVILGIPLLVNLAVFIGDIKSAGRPADKNDLIPPPPPIISLPYDATNSAKIAMGGLGEPGSTVYLTLNGQPVGEMVVKDDGTFQFQNLSLSEGDNTLESIATDQAGNRSNPSRQVKVYFSMKQPVLDVIQPAEGQQVTGGDARLEAKGTTDPNARITINDRVIVVGADGRFSAFVSLSSGENLLIFTATDRAGNQTRKEIKVSYSP